MKDTIKNSLINLFSSTEEALSVSDIYERLNKKYDKGSLSVTLSAYSDNSKQKLQYKKKLFTIVSENPTRFKLLKNDVQNERKFKVEMVITIKKITEIL